MDSVILIIVPNESYLCIYCVVLVFNVGILVFNAGIPKIHVLNAWIFVPPQKECFSDIVGGHSDRDSTTLIVPRTDPDLVQRLHAEDGLPLSSSPMPRTGLLSAEDELMLGKRSSSWPESLTWSYLNGI